MGNHSKVTVTVNQVLKKKYRNVTIPEPESGIPTGTGHIAWECNMGWTPHDNPRLAHRITNADSFDVVWKRLSNGSTRWHPNVQLRYSSHGMEKSVIWSGWGDLHKHPNAIYHLLEKLWYFIHPYRLVIDKYTSCRINRSKSHLDLESLSLLSV
jgi:hypothetical protein